MRRFVVVLGIFGLGLLTGFLIQKVVPKAVAFDGEGAGADGAATPTTACGDADGDGKVNITDPIYLLNWLFLGGENPTCRTGSLPATGQAKCYNDAGQEITPCPGGEARTFAGEDGFWQRGCPAEQRFIENHDGTITDACTGLMWQKMTALPPAGSPHDPEGDGFITWEEALAYCASLGDEPSTDSRFDGAGHTDWRLPNARELESLINYGKEELPHVYGIFNDAPKVGVAFDQLEDGFHVRSSGTDQYYEQYWSSTTLTPGVGNQAWAYYVELRYGSSSWAKKGAGWYVRAVRGP